MNSENTGTTNQGYSAEELAVQLREYEDRIPMNAYEKRALRKWVAQGHSVHEAPPTRYALASQETDFLDAYRLEKYLEGEVRGMSREQKKRYLWDFYGFHEESALEKKKREDDASTPPAVREELRRCRREIFHLGEFLYSRGLYEEAQAYVVEKAAEEIPFE